MKLIATKSYRYKTRRLQAGDEFDVTDMRARILVGARMARYAPEPAQSPPAAAMVQKPVADEPPPPVSHETSAAPVPAEHRNSIDDLREEAEALGIAVDGRWGIVRLQAEIARAKL